MQQNQPDARTGKPPSQQNEPQRRDQGGQNQPGADSDADGQPAPDATNGGSGGGYGQGLSGGVDVGAIEPGRSQNNGEVDR